MDYWSLKTPKPSSFFSFEQPQVIGRQVEALEEAGPQDLLKLSGGVLVPLALVKEVHDRRIVVDAPEGLFELEE